MTTQLDLLDAIATDPVHADDAAKVEAAILADAAAHDGRVDPNRVRAALTNQYGLTVTPQVVGSVYRVLRTRKVIDHDSWTVSTDVAGRNAGKMIRTWRLVGVA